VTPPGSWQPVPARDPSPASPASAPAPRQPTPELPTNGVIPRADPTCIFCDRPVGSTGYAWPDWLCDFLTEHQSDWDLDREEPGSGSPIIDQVASEIDQTVTCVCDHCNENWIARLEEGVSEFVKPMIMGETTPLPAARRKLLARWAAKNAVIMENTFGDFVRTPHGASEQLRKTSVHAGTQVLVGRYDGDRQLLNRARVLFRKDASNDHYVTYTTLIVGRLLIQVLADPWNETPPEVPETAARRFISLVGNRSRNVAWPPEISSGDAFFEAVRRGPDVEPRGRNRLMKSRAATPMDRARQS
jgi:hypothetical protein